MNPMQFVTGAIRVIGGASLLVFVQACNLAPHYMPPTIAVPVAFKEGPQVPAPDTVRHATTAWSHASPNDRVDRGAWWTMFHDSTLDRFEGEVDDSNQSIAAAFANFLAARAIVREARAQYVPTVTVSPSLGRSRQSVLALPSGDKSAVSTYTAYALPFDASWEVDVWGRVRNDVTASTAEAQATYADLDNVRLTIHAELAVDYFQLRTADREQQVLDSVARLERNAVELMRVQAAGGIASGQEVAVAEEDLATAEAQATDLGIQRAQLEHAIATLLGHPASLFTLSPNGSAAPAVEIPPTVPSTVLERRPDIAAAERRVAAANAEIGVARGAYFPALTLSGLAGYQSTALQQLISVPSLIWSVGATLTQSLFDGGARKGVTDQAWAAYQATVANYRQTVLAAFQDVEDNLAAVRIVSTELAYANDALAAAQGNAAFAVVRDRSGLGSDLDVITAQLTVMADQRTVLALHLERLIGNIQLIKATGGTVDAPSDSRRASNDSLSHLSH